jgi:glycerol-3-phosphate acyltransferase PlsY
MDLQAVGIILLSFLAGGIPTGYLVVWRLKGFDIRTKGSGNPGTANVYRMAGAKAGAITLVVDALKGYFPVLLAMNLYPGRPDFPIYCGIAAIVGHDWTPFLGFKGGKGVATSAGVCFALMPLPMALSTLVFIAGVWGTGHISVGSMTASAALPLINFLLSGQPLHTAVAAGASALILYKHIPNIQRLLQRKELHVHEEKS